MEPKLTFAGLLQIVLITLKLCEIIQWDWWIVLIPSFNALFWNALLVAVRIAQRRKRMTVIKGRRGIYGSKRG